MFTQYVLTFQISNLQHQYKNIVRALCERETLLRLIFTFCCHTFDVCHLRHLEDSHNGFRIQKERIIANLPRYKKLIYYVFE